MGNNISNINDLKNSSEFREFVMKAMKSVLTNESKSKSTYTKSKTINAQSLISGTNYVSSGKTGVMIGSKSNPIRITEKTNQISIVKSVNAINYIKTEKDPIVQVISSDITGLTESNITEKEIDNWYDPKYVMNSLGFDVSDAQFDFENKGIKYLVNIGEENAETIRENNIIAFEKAQEQQKANKNHNKEYSEIRSKYVSKQNELSELKSELETLMKQQAASDVVTLQNQCWIYKNNCSLIIQKAQTNKTYVNYAKSNFFDSNGDYKLEGDALNQLSKIKSNTIYTTSVDYLKTSLLITKKPTIIEILNGFTNSTNQTAIKSKYSITDSSFESFTNEIKQFIPIYNSYVQNLVLKGLYELKDNSPEINTLYNSFKSNLEQAQAKQIEIKNILNNNSTLKNSYDDLNSQIESLQAELETKEALNALLYYEYYDTEEINETLIKKVDDDVSKAKTNYDQLAITDEQKQALQILQSKESSVFFSECDYKLYEQLITTSEPYIYNYSSIISEMEKQGGTDEMKSLMNSILSNTTYKSKYNDISKNKQEYEKAYITAAQVINETNDSELISNYVKYMTLYDEWISDNLSISKVVNKSFPSDYNNKHSKQISLMKTNYEKYTTAYDSYIELNEELNAEKEKYNSLWGDSWNKLSEASAKWNKLKTASKRLHTLWTNYKNATDPEYDFISFEELYLLFSAGYTQNIIKKVSNFSTISTNLKRNITELSELYATNRVVIDAVFMEGADIELTNNAMQVLISNIDNVSKIIDDIKNKSKTSVTPTTNSTPSPTTNIIKEEPKNSNTPWYKQKKYIIIIIIVFLSISGIITFIILYAVISKRKQIMNNYVIASEK